jgi:hypothetical protein
LQAALPRLTLGLGLVHVPFLRQKWSRGQVETRLVDMPPCLNG